MTAGVFGNEDSGLFNFLEVMRMGLDIDGFELDRDFETPKRCWPRMKTYGPECSAKTVIERAIWKISPRCDGCPYPGHGFVCWGADGSCIRSRIAEINQIEKEDDTHASDAMQS